MISLKDGIIKYKSQWIKLDDKRIESIIVDSDERTLQVIMATGHRFKFEGHGFDVCDVFCKLNEKINKKRWRIT
jgi:hypothetical protein